MSTPNNNRRRSRVAVDGLDRTPHRTFLRATGLDDAALARPFVAVISTHGDNTPCSKSLRPQADAAKAGVAAAGGTPFEMTTISVSDGVAMNHRGMRMSLVSREWIADSVEIVVRGHGYDALVGFAGCDKTLPAMMMAMVRLDVPSVFMYGGAMLRRMARARGERDRHVRGGRRGPRGKMSESDLAEMERACAPTMLLSRAVHRQHDGDGVGDARARGAGTAMLPAPTRPARRRACRGETAMRILRDGGPLPRELVTRESLENAAAAVAATGGSTNAGLHLPAIAHEAGIRFTLDDVAEVFRRTPLVADLQPGGSISRAICITRRVDAVLKVLLDGGYLHGDCLTLSGRTLKDRLARAPLRTARWCARLRRRSIRPAASWCSRATSAGRGADQDRRPEVARVRGLRPRLRVRGGRGRGVRARHYGRAK